MADVIENELTKNIVKQILSKPKNFDPIINNMFQIVANLNLEQRKAVLNDLTNAALLMPQKDYERFEALILKNLSKQPDVVRRAVLESNMLIIGNLSEEYVEKARLATKNIVKDIIAKPGAKDDIIITVYEELSFMRPDMAVDFTRSILDSTLDLPNFIYDDFMKRRMALLSTLPEDNIKAILRYSVTASAELSPQKHQKDIDARKRVMSHLPQEKKAKLMRIMGDLGIDLGK